MISVTILTKNSGRHLERVLRVLKNFDDIILLDSGSEDDTLEIAQQFPHVTIHHRPLTSFGEQHNHAAALAKHDWILSIDSDEVLSKELAQEMTETTLDPNTVYSIQRRNHYGDQWIRGCGWSPDVVPRLYHRRKTQWSDDRVHEKVLTKGMAQHIFYNPVLHYPYAGVDDLLRKMQQYTTLFAEQHRGHKRSSLCKAVLHGGWALVKSYLLKGGFRDGRAGWIISLYNAHTAYYKYLKLANL